MSTAAEQLEPDGLARLAASWAELGPGDRPPLADHLATILRKLGAVLRAEPFRPRSARELGGELLTSGLFGDAADQRSGSADALGPTLRLLRREAAPALGVPTVDGRRRVVDALDELVAGLVSELVQLHRREPRWPSPHVVDVAPTVDARHIRDVYTHAEVGIGIVTLDGVVLDLNPALRRIFGVIGPLDQPRPISDFVHPDDLADAVERLGRLVRGDIEVMRMEVRLIRADSHELWAHVVATRVLDDDGRPSHLTIVVQDFSDRNLVRSRLGETPQDDQLLRLGNRELAEQWMHRAFSGVGTGGPARVGLCAVELDGFRSVSRGHGPRLGDRLLLAVAGRLRVAAADHLIARTGVDRFAVLVADPENAADVCRLADRLLAVLATPFDIDGQTFTISASIGVAEGPTARAGSAEMLRAADVARSWAKALGGGRRVVFDHEHDAVESGRFALLVELPGALERGEFRLDYQPLVRLTDGRVEGVEALVRWHHPEQGLVGPARFIELAEHSGAIVPLGRWVLETACAQAESWRRELGAGSPYVSVNVSPVQMATTGWVPQVLGALDSTGLPPHLLQLEITEKAVLGDEAAVLDALDTLRGAGVRLALDDFGTGYSSLAWLRRLPVHTLKIDGSFIDGLRRPAADPVDSSIVCALVEMAHALGLDVTAEWVETSLQAERLVAMGCDSGQGHWFGDAGPAGAVAGLWRRSISP